jgi:glycosyltransferase involved in cell wall biosynthesis
MNKMRLLVGMPDKNSLGGPIYCEPPFVESLRDAGVEVDEEVYVYGDGGTATSLFRRILRVLDAARRLRARTREKQYDVIHLNTSFDEKCVVRDLVTMFYLRKSGVPVHLKMHGSIAAFLRTENAFWRYLQRRVFKTAANIGVLSSEERELFLAAGCPAEKLSDARYVVVAEEFKPDPEFCVRHGIDEKTPILLFSARFVPTKGLLDLIKACGELKQAGRDFILFCLGDGPIRAGAEKLVEQLDLADRVRFTGYISENATAVFHANSTIFVFPTYHDEGFPLVLLKSLAAGMPIITTQIRAAADKLTEPDNCLWVKPHDPRDVAEKISRLLDDHKLQAAMSTNNRLLAEQFSPRNIAQEYSKLYKAIAQKEVRP